MKRAKYFHGLRQLTESMIPLLSAEHGNKLIAPSFLSNYHSCGAFARKTSVLETTCYERPTAASVGICNWPSVIRSHNLYAPVANHKTNGFSWHKWQSCGWQSRELTLTTRFCTEIGTSPSCWSSWRTVLEKCGTQEKYALRSSHFMAPVKRVKFEAH